MGSLGRGDKQDVVAMVEAKAGICCGRARQRTATSANLCLAFAMERFLSRKWWVGAGAAGKGIPIPMASLCFGGPQGRFLGYILRLGGPHHREGKG